MNEQEAKQLPTYQQTDPLAGLPEYLKHPSSYMKVEKALLETLTCGKLHSGPLGMRACKKCTENMLARRALMEKLGFKSIQQYFSWRKTHQHIKARVPLDKYNEMIKQDI